MVILLLIVQWTHSMWNKKRKFIPNVQFSYMDNIPMAPAYFLGQSPSPIGATVMKEMKAEVGNPRNWNRKQVLYTYLIFHIPSKIGNDPYVYFHLPELHASLTRRQFVSDYLKPSRYSFESISI